MPVIEPCDLEREELLAVRGLMHESIRLDPPDLNGGLGVGHVARITSEAVPVRRHDWRGADLLLPPGGLIHEECRAALPVANLHDVLANGTLEADVFVSPDVDVRGVALDIWLVPKLGPPPICVGDDEEASRLLCAWLGAPSAWRVVGARPRSVGPGAGNHDQAEAQR
jgi:hypothetical protein